MRRRWMASQEIFRINSKLIKKAVSAIRKLDKNLHVYLYGKGSEVYLHISGAQHFSYAHYKLEDVKIQSDFSFSVSMEELYNSVLGATGDVIFNKHSEYTIEVDANTKKSYLICSDATKEPILKINDKDKYSLAGERIIEFGKAFNSNFINS
jgi:hypothetical protein